MTATAILGELQRLGVSLEVVGDRLRYRPREAVTPDLVEALRKQKGELLKVLTMPATGHGLCPGPEYCSGCYSVGMVDGRERWIHPPRAKEIDWNHFKPATEKIQ